MLVCYVELKEEEEMQVGHLAFLLSLSSFESVWQHQNSHSCWGSRKLMGNPRSRNLRLQISMFMILFTKLDLRAKVAHESPKTNLMEKMKK